MSKIYVFLCGLLLFSFFGQSANAQNALIINILEEKSLLPYATVKLPALQRGGTCDSLGRLILRQLPAGRHTLEVSLAGYFQHREEIFLGPADTILLQVGLQPQTLQEVVVSGTMKAVRRSDSPIPVEIVTPQLFRRNPSPNLFEAVGMVSGVQPVVGCNVCNTGDIHINGMEGPYTLVALDGMPIVSGLATVYGLMGIPNSMIERIEVVKGPAGALYGSEAMAGMLNVITKSPEQAPRFSLESFGSSWGEYNLDLGARFKAGKSAHAIIGLNGFVYDNPQDRNRDGFTDLTLQKRISLFNKWQWKRPENRLAQLGIRLVGEDRWGGQMAWTPALRGSDSLYGESIYTGRLELIGLYQMPWKTPVFAQFSYSSHHQNSFYGTTPYHARQDIGFAQLYWNKQWSRHETLLGATLRYTIYNDNTPATPGPAHTPLPGAFLQDEWSLRSQTRLLSGLRADFHPEHGLVWAPRLALRQGIGQAHTLRLSGGSGFRVVNLFTEEHAALTGARILVIAEALQPERSWGGNANWEWKIPRPDWFLRVDLSAFFTYFSNRIIADYDTDPNLILYKNLDGYAQSRGATLQLDYSDFRPLKALLGITYMDVFQKNINAEGSWEKTQQLHAPRWSGNWSLTYTLAPQKRHIQTLTFDCTGNWYGPQRLPILPNDFRPEYSPWFALAHIQATIKWKNRIELFGGVKNLFNFIPQNPIMRPFDPFDKTINDPINNPNAYTFDPSYNFAPLQGIRGFLGIRFLTMNDE